MGFSPDPLAILKDFDGHNTLWRAFLQSLYDHGGRGKHLDQLVAALAKGDRHFVTTMAKLAVGSIWSRIDQPRDLGLIRYDLMPHVFLRGYPEIDVHPGSYVAVHPSEHIMRDVAHEHSRPGYSETQPKGPCRYALAHSPKPLTIEELGGFDWGEKREPASWREWIAYVATMSQSDYCDCTLVCAGSRRLKKDGEELPTVLEARSGPPRMSCVGWRDTNYHPTGKRGNKFDTNCFYVVRVYE